jgi:hypothetical protein
MSLFYQKNPIFYPHKIQNPFSLNNYFKTQHKKTMISINKKVVFFFLASAVTLSSAAESFLRVSGRMDTMPK